MGTSLLPSVQTCDKKTGPCSNGALLVSLKQTDGETQVSTSYIDSSSLLTNTESWEFEVRSCSHFY